MLLRYEATTHIAIAHQLDVLELIRDLNQRSGLTVIAVLHDLAQAARYCDRCVVMGEGRVRTDGVPAEALSAGQIERNFAVNAWVTTDPSAGHPVIVPRHRVSAAPPENRETEGAP